MVSRGANTVKTSFELPAWNILEHRPGIRSGPFSEQTPAVLQPKRRSLPAFNCGE